MVFVESSKTSIHGRWSTLKEKKKKSDIHWDRGEQEEEKEAVVKVCIK